MSGWAGTGDTQPHKHTGHSTGIGAGGGGWAPYCTLGVGPGRDPLNWSLGRRLEAVVFPRPSGGRVRPQPGPGEEGWAATCPALERAEGWSLASGRTSRANQTQRGCTGSGPGPCPHRTHPHTGSAAKPPFAPLRLGGHGEAFVTLTVRAAAADIRDLQLRVAVLLSSQRGLWTPSPWQCQAGGCCQA